MANIIVAIACNLIVALVLASSIFSTFKLGIKFSSLKLASTIMSVAGAFLITPAIIDILAGISIESSALNTPLLNVFISLGISISTVNSIVYLILFTLFYLFGMAFCNIIKHIFVKGVREGSINKARLKRAKSINAKAEKLARKAEWKEMVAKYTENITWWKRLISIILSSISALIIGFVILIPYKFIAEDLVIEDPNKQYLLDGYDYTLNGLIENKIELDIDGWLIGIYE